MQQKQLTESKSYSGAGIGSYAGNDGRAPLLDVPEQIQWLHECARSLGYAGIDELFWNDPDRFNSLAGCWRNYRRRLYLH